MKRAILCLLAVCMLAVLASCKKNGETGQSDTEYTGTEINYDGIDVYEYVKEIKYKGLEIEFGEDNAANSKMMWANIYASAVISSYPEDKVTYYFEQTRKSYMYSVGNNKEDYELLLEQKGITEQDMLDEAKQMVKEDLVYEYIIRAEGIELTDAERAENFDKYVTKLSEQFGVREEYMRAEMSDYVYDTMLRDKTTEFLFSVNK